jgi:GntR family transcriptional repressor for pyruvate dehydrogenase complex
MERNKREYEKAISYIRQLIAEGKLQTGSRLPTERTIADTLSISRNSTREALRTLENMGIMESRQGSGNYLVGGMPIKIAEIFDMMLLMQQTTAKEICQFRRSMEKSVCDLVISNPKVELSKIPPVLDNFLTSEPDKQIELDQQFHYLLIYSTKNQFLIMLMDAITDMYGRWINMVLRDAEDSVKAKLHATHNAMYQSLIRKDLITCIQAIDEHYNLIDSILALEK